MNCTTLMPMPIPMPIPTLMHRARSHSHSHPTSISASNNPLPLPAPSLSSIVSYRIVSYPTTIKKSHQSSSSSPFPFPCILACLALNASASPPAKLGCAPAGFPSGAARPLSPFMLMLTALSRSAGGSGAGFLPVGRLGGAGGTGLDLPVVAAGRCAAA